MSKKLTHEEFLERLYKNNEHYRNGEFEVVDIYKGINSILKIKSINGECLISSKDLLKRNGKPHINSAIDKTEYFKNEVFYNNIYYRQGLFEIMSEYTGRKNKIKILHNTSEYDVVAVYLLKDYLPGIKTVVDKNKMWLEKFKSKRKDFYNIDYSFMNYKTSRESTTFICKIHNIEYNQRLDHHYNNIQGCIKCMQHPIIYNNFTIVKHKTFLEEIEGYLYVIKLESEEESFYKIGITGKERLNYRFSELKNTYKLNFEYLQEGNMVELFKLEQKFLKEFKNYKYSPLINFRGYTECLTINPINYYYKYESNN